MRKIIAGIFALVLLVSVSFAAVEGTNTTIKVNKVVTDEIEEKGEIDYFSFYISKPGSLQVEFDFDVESEYTVKLINEETGKTIQSNKFSSSVNSTSGRVEKVANRVRVEDAAYQVQVSSSNYLGEEYKLKVLYEAENSDRYEKESNNQAKTAMIIDYNTRVVGNLEASNDVDYYMVEIPDNGEIYAELRFDKNAAYNVEIYQEVNGSIKSIKSKKFEAKLSQNYDTYFDVSEIIRVPSGNYYFKVSKSGSYFSNEDYEFAVRFLDNSYGNYEIENNNEAKHATEITSNTEFIGNLNSKSDSDFYKLSLWDSNKLTVKMNVPEGGAYTVITYKEENGELKQLSSESFGGKNGYGWILGKLNDVTNGNYYFKVSSRTYSNSNYTFLVVTNDVYASYGKSTIVLEINNPYMLVNGVTYAIDGDRGTAPIILNSRTVLPIRAVIEHLGGSVSWIPNEKGINIVLGNNNIYLNLDSTLAYVNGEAKYLDVAPTSINSRTMMPVKFIMDNLGGTVIWDGNKGSVTITY